MLRAVRRRQRPGVREVLDLLSNFVRTFLSLTPLSEILLTDTPQRLRIRYGRLAFPSGVLAERLSLKIVIRELRPPTCAARHLSEPRARPSPASSLPAASPGQHASVDLLQRDPSSSQLHQVPAVQFDVRAAARTPSGPPRHANARTASIKGRLPPPNPSHLLVFIFCTPEDFFLTSRTA